MQPARELNPVSPEGPHCWEKLTAVESQDPEVTRPAEADLPEDIAGLSRRQYVSLRRRYPSVNLAFLVKQITEADPELAKVTAHLRSSTERVPHQLPAAAAHFAGRMGELARLTGLLRGRADAGGTVVISAIAGSAGVGKTKPGS